MATRMTLSILQALACALWLPVVWAQSKPLPQRSLAAKEEQVSPELIAMAQRVHEGKMPCELGASVFVVRDAAAPGYFNINVKGFRYRMKMVSTTTGAIRLEDAKAGAVWLQLANKSMLMDQKKGRRLADECAHIDQVAFAKDMVNNPPPALIDTTGMGR